MHTVYDWLSARGDRAARDGRRNRRQREWPAMSGDTVDCGHPRNPAHMHNRT
jgi:hypothetical protein